MKLLTKELKDKIPPLYTNEQVAFSEQMVVAKFFDPYGSWTWYVMEGEPTEDGDFICYGLVDGFEKEFGYFSLKELESVEFMGKPRIERDLYFEPCSITNFHEGWD